MGGGDKSKSKSKSGFAQDWAQPHAMAGMNNIEGVVNANAPGLQNMTNMIQQQIVPGVYGKYQAGLAGANAARDYNMDILGGKYMDGNPYMQSMIDKSRADIGDDVNGVFARSGRYGSGAHEGVLVDHLADMENQYRFQNYSQEMARRDAAAQALRDANSQDLGQTLGAIGLGAEIPYTGIQSLANSLGALAQGDRSKSTQGGGGLLGGILGAGASLGSAALSNPAIFSSSRDLKADIEEMGPWDDKGDGLTKVSFRYKSDPTNTRYIGVIAEDVQRLRPWAFVPNFAEGKPGVNYAAL